MKRVLKGVHVLMAVGLIVALAACSGSNGSLKRERDQAQAAAAAAEAAAAQAAADKMAAEAAAAQAEADKMAADEAAAQAEADKMAAEAAAAQAEADKMAAEAAAAQAEADLMAAEEAAAQAAAQAEADKMAAAEAAAQAAADLMAAEEAAAQAAADLMAAEEAAAQAAAEKKALEDELAGVPKTIEELEAALMVASDALTAAAEAQAAADTALADATVARMAAQAAVDASEADGLTDAIVALQAARAAEAAAEVAAMAAAEVATAAEADVATVQAAVDATDTGPASETLTDQQEAADIKGAQAAFKVLANVPSGEDDDVITRKATSILKVSHDGMAVKFSASGPAWTAADNNIAPGIHGWASGTLTGKPATGETGTGIVYSNIEAPEYTFFAVEYMGTSATMGEDDTSWTDVVIAPGNKYTGGTGPGSIPGSFRGIDGSFECGDQCGATPIPTRRSNGTLSSVAIAAITGDWTFEPTDTAAMVKTSDADYLTFGYWLSKDKTGPKQFQVWYGGEKAVGETADITALDEKVTYTGAAAGKYVTKDDVANTAQAGYFTATAELTADFSGLADDGPGKLTGTISDFKAGDSTPLGNLKLLLAGDLDYPDGTGMLVVDMDPRGDTDPQVTNLVTAESSGLKHGTVGGWEAQLFGAEPNTNIPTGVAGAFNAEIPDQAVVVGSFGATK